MTNITNFQDILGAANGDKTSVLGKFLYFSLANILVEKGALAQLCEDLSIPYSGSKRISVSDAFRSATGDIKDRITVKSPGAHHIYAVYCRDNAHTEDVYSRELVKETLNQRTNQYEKLANIFYDRRDNRFGYDNIGFDADIDPLNYCRRAEELFELYQVCANRRQIETICLSYLRMLEATKVSSTGHLYFIPRQHMDKVDTFETFIEQLSAINQNDNALSVNNFYIIDGGILFRRQERDRTVSGEGRLSHPERQPQPRDYGAVGQQNCHAGAEKAALRRNSSPGARRPRR